MILAKFSYLFYTLLFTLIPILILWTKKFNFLKKNIKIVFYSVLIGLIYTFISSPFAQLFGAWHYSNEKVLGVFLFNFPIEDLIFAALVSAAISSAVMVFVYYIQRGRFSNLFHRTKL